MTQATRNVSAAGAGEPDAVLLDYRAAANVLSIGVRTLSDLVKYGQIPVVRIRARVLFRPAALAAWAKAQENTARPANDSVAECLTHGQA